MAKQTPQPEVKLFDFEVSDPIEAHFIYGKRNAEINNELPKLEHSKDRYTNPAIPEKIAALQAEQQARYAAWDSYVERTRGPWLENYSAYMGKMNQEEGEFDKKILQALKAIKDLCRERARMAAKRNAAQKQWAAWAEDARPEVRLAQKQMPIRVMSTAIPMMGGGLEETSHHISDDIFQVFLRFAAVNDLNEFFK